MSRMRASSHVSAGALALALLPVLWVTDAAAETCDDPFTTDLVAYKNVVGAVEVCNDATDLHVTYVADKGWCLLQTRLDVADDLADIPQTRRG